MAAPKDPAEHALVVKAISSGVGGCCEWDDRAAQRFRSAALPGLTPEGVKDELIEFVGGGGSVVQVKEKRPEYSDRRFYYKVIFPLEGLRHGLFIEIILDDDDDELPSVRIVNCHEQRK